MIKKTVPFLLFFLSSIITLAQDSIQPPKKFRHELGLDVANTIFLVRKTDYLYLINYKFHFNKHAIRSGINLLYETHKDGQKSIDYRLGFEWKRYWNKWEVFYGVDLGFLYRKYNFQHNTITKYHISPLIGFRYFISPRFSISTEPKINFAYLFYRNPQSFALNSDSEDWEIRLISIGVVLVNFHF